MAQNPSNPDLKPATRSGAVSGLVRAERLLQIAFILPASVFVGWLIGAGLDKWLHQTWIYLPGLLLGAVAGFVEVFHLVLSNEKAMEKEDRAKADQARGNEGR
ncbi:MAG TPA: AtpZ/AtpI family protein [Acidobacteriaceae bacterium]|jgi:F0F1-type ATP synthase assembly protein I|nr:AtpZ/AtpI family protein [Acidobacteriaceae bacterium]